MKTRKKGVSILAVAIVAALVVGSATAAFVALWNRQPTVELATAGFVAKLVDHDDFANMILLWDDIVESTILEPMGTGGGYRICLVIKEMRALYDPYMLIGAAELGLPDGYYAAIVNLQLWATDGTGTGGQAYVWVNGVHEPLDSTYTLDEAVVGEPVLWDRGDGFYRYILIEYILKQTGEAIGDTVTFTGLVELQDDMYEPPP